MIRQIPLHRMTLAVLILIGLPRRVMAANIERIADGKVNVSRHLGVVGRVNLGSFYTPAKYVEKVAGWLKQLGVDSSFTVADLSCGYGAFFELRDVEGLEGCRYIGNDIDAVAVCEGRKLFPFVEWSTKNALYNVSRNLFGIASEEKLVIVGNPPYNDVTSQINRNVKTNEVPIDADIRTRDLGMSSLLAYGKLNADVVAVLHPLSYLIKKANFKVCDKFFSNYRMVNHIVFSSQEFAGTSKVSAFPVIVAVYVKSEGRGLTYQDVCKMKFVTVEGATFSVDGFDYVTENVAKYPHDKRYDPEILFYTMRDINALKRCRTFVKKRIANAVDVDPEKISYYCYIDCFKRFASAPYYLGNFNVPYDAKTFPAYSNDFVAVSKYFHRDIFTDAMRPSEEATRRCITYIKMVLSGKDGKNEYR